MILLATLICISPVIADDSSSSSSCQQAEIDRLAREVKELERQQHIERMQKKIEEQNAELEASGAHYRYIYIPK